MMNHANGNGKIKDATTPPLHVRVERFERMMDSGAWFPILRGMYLILSKPEVSFIQDLFNRLGMTRRKMRVWKRRGPRSLPPVMDDGSFRCTYKYLQNPYVQPVWSTQEQRTLFTSLGEKGYVTTHNRGLPRKRWVKIHTAKLVQALEKAELELRGESGW